MKELAFLVGGYFVLKATTGIDLLSMLLPSGVAPTGTGGGAPSPTSPTTPAIPSTPSGTVPVNTSGSPTIGGGGYIPGVAIEPGNEPIVPINPTFPTQVAVPQPSRWNQVLGLIYDNLAGYGNDPYFNFHQWNDLARQYAGVTNLPSPEEVGAGNGMELISGTTWLSFMMGDYVGGALSGLMGVGQFGAFRGGVGRRANPMESLIITGGRGY